MKQDCRCSLSLGSMASDGECWWTCGFCSANSWAPFWWSLCSSASAPPGLSWKELIVSPTANERATFEVLTGGSAGLLTLPRNRTGPFSSICSALAFICGFQDAKWLSPCLCWKRFNIQKHHHERNHVSLTAEAEGMGGGRGSEPCVIALITGIEWKTVFYTPTSKAIVCCWPAGCDKSVIKRASRLIKQNHLLGDSRSG